MCFIRTSSLCSSIQPLGRSAVALRCLQCCGTKCSILVPTVQVLVQTMPWIACNTWNGYPFDEHSRLLADVKEDLEKAKAIPLPDQQTWGNTSEGQTFYKKRGSVRKYYTLVEGLGSVPQGGPMTWRVHYTSHSGRVMWLHTRFDRLTWKHEIEADFFVYTN